MKKRKRAGQEAPGEAALAIGAALDFLEQEADTAGLAEVAQLIRRASAVAKQRGAGALGSERGAPQVPSRSNAG
ncbi:MAG TPA: hypothetical protein VKZ85_11135 [Woeseiaceae bacterium]|nr:hypothetical protein [Woeseiaceae bacterium]